MVKKFTQNQVERLLDLVPYLSTNQGVSLEKIASDFQTDKSTVIDDLNTLWMCGLPGYTPLELIDLSFDTGFVSIRNAEVLSKPRKLSSLELATVIVGLSILLESIPSSSPHFEAITDLLSRLSTSSNVPVPMSISSNVNSEVRSILEQGLKSKHNISILYHSFAKDIESTREIQPIGFQFIDGYEYLDSFCYTSKDFRLFRLDRIKEATVTGLSESVSHLSEKNEVLRQFFFTVSSNSRKVSEIFHVKIPPENSDSKEFESTAFNDEWIIRTFCSLNSAATLTQPADLRSEVAMRANRALTLYL
jgi:proteasome accessory factor C